MHHHSFATLICIGAALVACSGAPLFAGDTDPPPGPVTSTMKTLDEVEPRIAIQSLPGNTGSAHIISQSGSYYLTGDLLGETGKDGILVAASDVSIDLNGFALIGAPTSKDGIDISGNLSNIAVFNGTVRGWFNDGVGLTTATNSTLRDLRAYANNGNGLRIGSGALVTRCVSEGNSGSGIITGSDCVVSECAARNNASNGISPGGRSVVNACTAAGNQGVGFTPGSGSTVAGCNASGNATGIRVISNVTVRDNTCDQNQGPGAGIETTGADNTIEGNTVTRCSIGLDIGGSNHTIRNNLVKGNTDNYDISSSTNNINILLCEIPETIDWPATVTLAGSLTGASGSNGITVNADDVTIDLGGHALVGVPGSLDGVHVADALANVSIVDGFVHGWGDRGIEAFNAEDCRYQGIVASDNGSDGFAVGRGSHLLRCNANANGMKGINCDAYSDVIDCTAIGNFTSGIDVFHGSTVSGCLAAENATGIDGDSGTTIRNCVTRSNAGNGIFGSGAHIIDCVSSFNGGSGIHGGDVVRGCESEFNSIYGIRATSGARIIGNQCESNTTAGIWVNSSGCRIEENHVSGSPIGFDVDGIDNLIIRNSAQGNATDFDIVANNCHGPIVYVYRVGDIYGLATTDSPWTNFRY